MQVEFGVRAHFRPEGGHLFRETGTGLLTQKFPEVVVPIIVEPIMDRREQSGQFSRGQFLAMIRRTSSGIVEDFVAVGFGSSASSPSPGTSKPCA